MTAWIKGNVMSGYLQQQALAAYVHRYTREHIPAWAKEPAPNGKSYPVQFASDAEWLAHTEFPITKAGRLADRPGYCISSPTWPDGKPQELNEHRTFKK